MNAFALIGKREGTRFVQVTERVRETQEHSTMSTRAVYTFSDGAETHHVYKHGDGYPTGALQSIRAALDFAWVLPRFEADEFAAAFVAANKSYWRNKELELLRDYAQSRRSTTLDKIMRAREYQKHDGGGIRLMTAQDRAEFPADVAYHYVITSKRGKLWVTIHSFDFPKATKILHASLEHCEAWAQAEEAAEAAAADRTKP